METRPGGVPVAANPSSPLHFRPARGRLCDTIPFHHDGEYHIFYIRCDTEGGVPWDHIVSRDLVHWHELPTALNRDPNDPHGPDGRDMFTGCVVEHDGVFHIFYTGHNPANPDGAEIICHSHQHRSGDLAQAPEHCFGRTRRRIPSAAISAIRSCSGTRKPVSGGCCCVPDWPARTSPASAGWYRPTWSPGSRRSRCCWTRRCWRARPERPSARTCSASATTGICSTRGGGRTSGVRATSTDPTRTGVPAQLDNTLLLAGKRLFDGRRHIYFGPLSGDHDDSVMNLPRELFQGDDGHLRVRPVREVVDSFVNVVHRIGGRRIRPAGNRLSLPGARGLSWCGARSPCRRTPSLTIGLRADVDGSGGKPAHHPRRPPLAGARPVPPELGRCHVARHHAADIRARHRHRVLSRRSPGHGRAHL